jgi:glucose/mannose-6-phosphate isomerase
MVYQNKKNLEINLIKQKNMEQNLDKSNLRQVILDFPKQFEKGFSLGKNMQIKGSFESICISGMGGSSIPVDMLKAYIKYLRKNDPNLNKKISIFKNRGYQLPTEAYENCLNIFSSYSGGTEETLESLNEAIKNNLPSIGLANGGKLVETCLENNIPYISIPDVSQPRYALGYFFSILLQIISNHGFIQDFEEEISSSLEKLENDTRELEEKGKELAKKLFQKTPLIYTTEKMKAVGRIWKIKTNENAKIPCFFNYYPELNHNEMVGFTLPQSPFHIIALIDRNDHPKILKRMEITAKLLEKYNIKTDLIDIPDNENFFLSLFSSLALADWISYYLALEYGQDPTPVEMVENLKETLA